MNRNIICPHCDAPITNAAGLDPGSITCPLCAEEIQPAMVAHQTPEWVAKKMADRPFQPVTTNRKVMADAQVVMDVVAGINLRWKDNLIQALAIFVCVLIGALVGPFVASDWRPGLLVGAFVGLVAGFLISGFVLMLYRMFRH